MPSRWVSADTVLKVLEAEETGWWTPERQGLADMMQGDRDRVGGVTGLDVAAYRTVRAGLIALGSTEESS